MVREKNKSVPYYSEILKVDEALVARGLAPIGLRNS